MPEHADLYIINNMDEKKRFGFFDLANSISFQQFYESFWELTAVPIGIADPEFKVSKYFFPESKMNNVCRMIRSCPQGKQACADTDKLRCNQAAKQKQGIRYYCYAGLVDFAVPIYVEGRHVATIMCGQILPEPPSEKGFDKLWKRIENFSINKDDLKNAYFKMPYMTSQQLEALLRIVTLFAEYSCELGIRLIQNNKIEKHPEILKAKEFINTNFRDQITLDDIANQVYLSKPYFSRLFHKVEGITFTQYLQNIRLGESKKLLISTSRKIIDVAMDCGFNNISYFNELFLKTEKCSPKNFRKKHKS
ncbi:MAG TPA: PocR ligand-binding domain-containing protein [Sedimentisphaerales bacterium]|nr:PocR ligand-binding domain-containing protein [Sedimentisphaerales bacterium]